MEKKVSSNHFLLSEHRAYLTLLKFLTVTCDNASNNNIMMVHLVNCSKQANPSVNLDSDQSHICCLAHVIHLAVMEILIQLKAIKWSDVQVTEVDVVADLTEEEAESFKVEERYDVEGGEQEVEPVFGEASMAAAV